MQVCFRNHATWPYNCRLIRILETFMRFCWAQYSLWAVIIVLATLSMLAGCGAKGDLFLPPEEQTVQSVPETEAPQPEAQPQ